MKEMEFLTDRDLKYFERLESQGKAVIIRIDPTALLSLDFNSDKEEPLNREDLNRWLNENRISMQKEAELAEAIIKENDIMRSEMEGSNTKEEPTLARRLLEVDLSLEQRDIVDYAIQSGLSERDIVTLLRPDLSLEQMRDLCNVMIAYKN